MIEREIKKAYLEFMMNAQNIEKCEHCPENKNIHDLQSLYNYPCGQQNCWVTLHVNQFKGYTVEDFL